MLGPRVFGIGLWVAAGCAPAMTASEAPPPLMWFKPAIAKRPSPPGCVAQSRYNDDDLSTILKLRGEGESLKEVADEVGGSRHEVKCAEHSALTGKRDASKMDARFVQRK